MVCFVAMILAVRSNNQRADGNHGHGSLPWDVGGVTNSSADHSPWGLYPRLVSHSATCVSPQHDTTTGATGAGIMSMALVIPISYAQSWDVLGVRM